MSNELVVTKVPNLAQKKGENFLARHDSGSSVDSRYVVDHIISLLFKSNDWGGLSAEELVRGNNEGLRKEILSLGHIRNETNFYDCRKREGKIEEEVEG